MALDPVAAAAVRSLGGEIAKLHRRIELLEAGGRTAGLKYSSIDGGALVVNDSAGTTRQVIGAQPDGTVTTIDANAPPPAAPSVPLIGPMIGALVVGWDGLLGGAGPLSDFLWTEVHVSTASGFTPSTATLQRTMQAGGVVTVAGLTPGTAYYAVLVAVNRSRVSSAPSAQATGTPLATAQTIPPGTITAAQLAFSVTSGGGTVVTFAPTAPGSPATNDLWYDTAHGNTLYQWTGSTWQVYQFGGAALANGAVGAAQLGSGAVTAPALGPGAVGSAAIGPGAVGTSQVSFTASQIGGITTSVGTTAPSSPHTNDLWFNGNAGNQLQQWNGTSWAPYQFGTATIAAGSVTAALIAASTITAAQIAANTITAGQIAASTITASQIAAGTITAGQIATGTITASLIAAGTITGAQIAAGAITAAQIQAGTITAAQIATGTITAGQIQAGTISGGLLAAGIIYGGIVNGTVVTGATLQNSSANPRTSINPDGSYTVTNAAGVVLFRIGPDGTETWYDASGNLLMQLSPGGTQAIYSSLTGPAQIGFEPPSAPAVIFALYSAAAVSAVVNPVSQPTTAGNALTVIASAAGATDATGVTDSQGNTYTLVQSCTAVLPHMQVFQAVTGPGGTGPTRALGASDTITVALSAANTQQKNFIALATANVPTVSPLDFSAQATGTSAAPSVSGSPTGFGDAVLLIASWALAGGAGTVPDGWQLAQQSQVSGQQFTSVYYTANVSTGAMTGSATITSAAWCAVLLGYKDAVVQPAPAATAATLTPSTQWSDDGAFSCRVTKVGAATTWGITLPPFPVQAGGLFACRVVLGTLNVALGAVEIGFQWWTGPNGTGSSAGPNSLWTVGALGFNAFFPLTIYNALAPPGAQSATFYVLEKQADTAGNWFLLDNISVPGGLAYSNSPVATADQLGNPIPQGINFVGLPSLTSVLGVTDPYVGTQLAGIDGQGNVSGQNLNAATDLYVSGQALLGSILPNYSLGVVTRGFVTTGGNWPTTAIGATEIALLELDFIIPAGRQYLIQVMQATFIPTVSANTQLIQRLRYTTDGSTPTTASTQVAGHSPGVQGIVTANSGQNMPTPYMEWLPSIPAVDTTYRMLLSASIQAGSFQYATASESLEMRVTDVGNNAPVNNGVVLGTGGTGGAGAQTYTEHFYGNSTWTYNEYGLRNTNGSLYQGGYSGEGFAQHSWIQWSGGDKGNSLNTVLNYSVSKVSLRTLCQHCWYNSGMTVSLHSSSGAVGNLASVSSELGSYHANAGQFQEVILTPGIWSPFKAGGTTRLVLRPPGGSLDLSYYGYFWGGGGNNANVPRLTVTYTH